MDFRIVFIDGESYQGTYDLQHSSVRPPRLSTHVKQGLRYLAGEPPAWMLQHPQILADYRQARAAHPEETASAQRMLARYDLDCL